MLVCAGGTAGGMTRDRARSSPKQNRVIPDSNPSPQDRSPQDGSRDRHIGYQRDEGGSSLTICSLLPAGMSLQRRRVSPSGRFPDI